MSFDKIFDLTAELYFYFLIYSNGPSLVPVARCSACEIAWHRWEQHVVAVCGVLPVAAIAPVFPAGACRHY